MSVHATDFLGIIGQQLRAMKQAAEAAPTMQVPLAPSDFGALLSHVEELGRWLHNHPAMASQAPMDIESRAGWVQDTSADIARSWILKFATGQAAHKGADLGNVPVAQLLQEMEQEALDQLSYVRELKRRFIA